MMLRIGAVAVAFGLCAVAQEPAPDGIQPLLEAGNASYLHGDYDAARVSYEKAWELAKFRPDEDPARYEAPKRLSAALAALGQYDEANANLSLAISWREQIDGPDDPKIPGDLLQSVVYLKALKKYDDAAAVLHRVIGLHVGAFHGYENTDVADDNSRLAQVYLLMKKPDAAIGALKTALSIRTKLAGPLDPTLIFDLDRLGAAYTGTQDYEKAEDAFRHALTIRESLMGKDDADLIPDVDGLAFALFGQKKYDEAEPLYHRLIGLWTASTAADHPMLAVAWQKLGVFYSAQKKYDLAKDAFDKGNAIRALHLATGLAEQAADALTQGDKPDKPAVIALYRRALKPLDPPDPVYGDLRKDIEGMIAELGRKTDSQWKSAPPPVKKKE
ncbi:MAG TPA: tetratricopeptide repeat protein [Bryobacteraceae bacterium]|nr:tetratricopeptide repeat protein [Bryobacteraceae bacterium]